MKFENKKFEQSTQKSKVFTLVLIFSLIVTCFTIGYDVHAANLSYSTIIENGSMVETASYVIFEDGSTYYAKNGKTGAIDSSGTNASQIINNAFNALTAGRTWKEKVLIKGDITLIYDIIMPSYTHLEILGRIFLASGTNRPMIRNKDLATGNTFLEVSGSGVLDGNKAGQTVHAYSDVGVCGIDFENCTNVAIKGLTIKDTNCDGIALTRNKNAIIEGITSYNNYYDGIALLVEGHNVTANGNILHSNGRAGITADGQGPSLKCSKITISNNIISSCLGTTTISGGITLESTRDIVLSGNVISDCKGTFNDTNAVGLGIVLTQTQYSLVSANIIYNNTGPGIFLQTDSRDNTIIGNKITYNHYYGIWLYGGSGGNRTLRNVIVGNSIIQNVKEGILVEQSDETLISNNLVEENGNVGDDNAGIYNKNSEYTMICNNHIVNNDYYDVWISSTSNLVMLFGNNFYGTTSSGELLDSGTTTRKHDNIDKTGAWLAET